jgi:hypothetical protein
VIYLDFDPRAQEARFRLGKSAKRQPFGVEPAGDTGGEASLDELLIEPEEFSNLAVATPARQPGATEADRMSVHFAELVDEARSTGAFVVIDAPPLGEVGAAVHLVERVDQVLVTVKLGNSRRLALSSLREHLTWAPRRPTGLVLIGDDRPPWPSPSENRQSAATLRSRTG